MVPVLRSAGYEPDEFREMMDDGDGLEPGHALIETASAMARDQRPLPGIFS
jgi:hypothetical protein